MSSTTTLYVLTISYRKEFTINGAVDYSISPKDLTFERYFPYKPTLSEIKTAILDLNIDVNWIALDEREVEIKKTTLLGITNPQRLSDIFRKETAMNHDEKPDNDRPLWKVVVYFHIQPKPIRMDHVVYYTEDAAQANAEAIYQYWVSEVGKHVDHIEISIAEKWEA